MPLRLLLSKFDGMFTKQQLQLLDVNDEAYLVVDDGKDDSNNYDADADAAVAAVDDFDDDGTGLNTNKYNLVDLDSRKIIKNIFPHISNIENVYYNSAFIKSAPKF